MSDGPGNTRGALAEPDATRGGSGAVRIRRTWPSRTAPWPRNRPGSPRPSAPAVWKGPNRAPWERAVSRGSSGRSLKRPPARRLEEGQTERTLSSSAPFLVRSRDRGESTLVREPGSGRTARFSMLQHFRLARASGQSSRRGACSPARQSMRSPGGPRHQTDCAGVRVTAILGRAGSRAGLNRKCASTCRITCYEIRTRPRHQVCTSRDWGPRAALPPLKSHNHGIHQAAPSVVEAGRAASRFETAIRAGPQGPPTALCATAEGMTRTCKDRQATEGASLRTAVLATIW